MFKALTSILALSNTTFSICPTTGIPYSLSFPNLGIDFIQKSPFSSSKNISLLASKKVEELRKLPKVTLAGISIACLRQQNLLEMHEVPVYQANIYFQLCSTFTLINAIHFISSLRDSEREILPSLSLSSFSEIPVEANKSNNHLLFNYIKTCREVLHPPEETGIIIEEYAAKVVNSTSSPRIKTKTISKEDKAILCNAIKNVSEDFLASPKLIQVIRLLPESNTILSMDDSIRNKLISKLEVLQSPSSLIIINMLKKFSQMLSIEDMERASDSFAIVKAKKSLSEILAERKQNNNSEVK